MNACRKLLPGGRWHFQHGPIDLVLQVDGEPLAVARAHERAWQRFDGLLQELVAELAALRAPVGADCPLHGAVARRMWAACAPFRAGFITPMAAVAGAVAEEVLGAMREAAPLRRAYVNNGGDIALFVAPGESLQIGLVDRPDRPQIYGTLAIDAASGIGGVATSGWRGRSFSLGIADAVTVLARDAAAADAAATVIGNAVDLPGNPLVIRRPASDIDPDSALGGRQVTLAVGTLAPTEIDIALTTGLAEAERLRQAGLIYGAVLTLQGRFVVCGDRSKLMQAA